MAGRNEAALGLSARRFGNARPEVVEARFYQTRAELEEIERGGRLPVRLIVVTEQVHEPRAHAFGPVVTKGRLAVRGQLKGVAIFVTPARTLVVDDVDAAITAFDHQIERGFEHDGCRA